MVTTISFEKLLKQSDITFPPQLTNDDVVFLCVGTDRSTGDSLAPFVGSILTDTYNYSNVYGTLTNPVHAVNLEEVMEKLPNDKTIIAIDAALGQLSSIGSIHILDGGIKPGAGVGKELPEVGEYSIQGIVNVGGFMEYFVLQNTRLSLVVEMANKIVDVILHRFPLEVKEIDIAV